MLTVKEIENLAPRVRPYKTFDGGGLGLYLETFPNGHKLWRVQYRHLGKQKVKVLGDSRHVPLIEARAKAASFKLALSDGADPDQDSDRQTLPFREIAGEWSGKFLPLLVLKSRKVSSIYLEKFVFPGLGDLRPDAITPRTVLEKVLRPLADRPTTMGKVKTLLSQIFRYSVANGLMERDFTLDLRGAFPPSQVFHRPALTDPTEVGELLRRIDISEFSLLTGYALKILPYVFVRSSELRTAEWKDIDFDQALWKIPAAKMKMKTAHVIPMSSQVTELFKQVRNVAGDSSYVFPNMRDKDRPMSPSVLNKTLGKLGYEGKAVPHGFRTTASTLLNEMGYPVDWIELQLAHRERNAVRAAYNRAEHLEGRTKMMQEWADYLDRLRNGKV
ncbi:MAG: tyrosine-type recombinase/integrase [Deltaproteobacteria bacterium]|nr:tyrosine-type recombinase/integrase [Deltaproteobacteria bacterium]